MLVIPAYAKINLGLVVLGRRDDGFHDIDSVAVTIDWHDLIGIVLHPTTATEIRLRVTAGEEDIPRGPDNLAVRAVAELAAVVGPLAVDLWLDKRIPSRAGLGGGSADAAAVLRGALHLLAAGVAGRTPPGPTALAGIAASLGSDVPLLLAGGAQRVRGRGERLSPLAGRPMHLAVAIAGSSPTAAAYAAVGTPDHGRSDRIDRVVAALDGGFAPPDDDLGSALEAPAGRVSPLLAERLVELRGVAPSSRWHLTGSGGAAFAVARDGADAADLAARAAAAGFPARACRTVAATPNP